MYEKIPKLSMEQNTLLPFKELIVLTMKENKNQNIKRYKIVLALERKCLRTEFGQFQKISLSV